MSQGSGLLRRTVDRDGRADFVIAQRFEVGKLTIEQVGRHEVALSRSDPCGNQLTRARVTPAVRLIPQPRRRLVWPRST